MKAAYIEKVGPPENIIYGEIPTPQPQASEVLVKVSAVAVNPVDTYVRSGMLSFDLPLPFVVGCDLAGVVEATGPQVDRFQAGDRVWCSNQGLLGRQGTFAEYAVVDEQWLYSTPANIDDQTAAACALVSITAHLGLFRDAKLEAGETILVQGGSGGIGSIVIQMAKAVDARVITTAGSPEKVAKCLELGADVALNYREEDVATGILESTGGAGVNVFWETQREPDFDQIVGALSERGRIVLMAGREARPEFPVGPFYVKGCAMVGFAMFNASYQEQQKCADDINSWLADEKVRAHIDRILPLSETAFAHSLQEQNTVAKAGTLAGKIVLIP
ncbi:MAG: quinone oxidoreductase [Planctomycetaceae bacterium]|nr:quinone oxidoreductase [Planctomycetaceae bacterium]MBP60104.1 quinone oxidoreductase [Planctomycetaceae bacterium]